MLTPTSTQLLVLVDTHCSITHVAIYAPGTVIFPTQHSLASPYQVLNAMCSTVASAKMEKLYDHGSMHHIAHVCEVDERRIWACVF